jgi:hypothetical protein
MRLPTLPPRALRRGIALLACAGACTGAAQAMQVHGVDFAPQEQQAGQALVLNGAGTRSFFIFKVYAAGLYLPHPARDASAALAMPGPKHMRLVMLRGVSGKELGDKLDSDIRANLPPAEIASLAPSLRRLRGLFATQRELREGQSIDLRDEPGPACWWNWTRNRWARPSPTRSCSMRCFAYGSARTRPTRA